ncbi:type 4a pilus biogenesis protein PilO [Hippea sp. KM1]|uniref:type 4a pilus biogenesis protein PilO n=1 Tax=Hippea sp. KM1 TaxID=944481 RepID=UPI00046CC0FB|nr:type 4a pilus biogenesis protein PilO [Hippea sp. KM1]
MKDLDFKKALVIALVGVILIGGLWYYFYYKDATAQIDRLSRDIERLYKYKRQLPKLKREYKTAQAEFKKYSSKLPLKEEIPSLLVKLNDIIKREDVVLMNFNPKNAVKSKSGLYYIKPIDIRIRSTYVNCGNVFEKVAKMDRLFKVKSFSLSSPKVINSSKVLLDVKFSAETYYFKGKGR